MGHLVGGKEEAYLALADRLSRFPIKPRPLAEGAALIGMTEEKTEAVLNNMADKGLVTDIPCKGTTYYMLNPIVVGFFEFTLMRNDRANGPPG